MDKRLAAVKQLFSQKQVADYTYATLFFLISSLFAFLAIKPSLSIAFSLKREADDLAKLNAAYEKNIESIIKIQKELETVRGKTFLIAEATPDKPEIKTVIDNITGAVGASGGQLEPFDMPAIDLKGDGQNKTLKAIPIGLSLEGEWTALNSLIDELTAKRRLTVIKNLNIVKSEASSQSASLKSDVDIENYYL